jgi:hypothetical protein
MRKCAKTRTGALPALFLLPHEPKKDNRMALSE